MRTKPVILGLALAGGGCLEQDTSTPWLVRERRVIAITAEPAEAAPGAEVRYRAVVADPDGAEQAALAWWFCRTPRSLRENGAVSAACAQQREAPLNGQGLEIDAIIPADACARFGPETSAGLRPADPDASGGYYQPVVAAFDGQLALLRHRLRCALRDAPLALVQRFAREYQPNLAPELARVYVRDADRELALDALPAGAPLTLVAELEAGAREAYPRHVPGTARLVQQDERLETSWFITFGTLAEATVVAGPERASNRWMSPAHAAEGTLWIVLRDDRGGVSVRTSQLATR